MISTEALHQGCAEVGVVGGVIPPFFAETIGSHLACRYFFCLSVKDGVALIICR